MSIARLAAHLRTLVTRGKIVRATLNKTRVLLQFTGLADQTKDKVELFLPYGFSAFPKGGEVITLMIGGARGHTVALFADDPALRIQDLQEGEFGWRDLNGQQIVFRTDKIEIRTPKDLVLTVHGDVTATIDGDANVTATGDVNVDGAAINLGGAGGKKVVLDGDLTSDGHTVIASSTKVKAT